LAKRLPVREPVSARFEQGAVDSPPLIQALAVDLDLDGRTDVVGLSDEHRPVFLRNDDGRLRHVPAALGSEAGWPKDVTAGAVAAADGDGLPDLLVWPEPGGRATHRNGGNGNHGIQIIPSGHRKVCPAGDVTRCNADGVGTWVQAQTRDFWTGVEYTTLSAG